MDLIGYGLTTAEILYRLPDHPSLLQMYLWQEYDNAPRFPVLQDFLEFWEKNIEGPLHRVTVSHGELVSPTDIKSIDELFGLN